MKRILIVAASCALLVSAASAQEFGPWSAPVNLGSTINSAANDMHPSLSKDGLSLYFSSDRLGASSGRDLWVSQRDSPDSPWQPPQNLTMLNTPYEDHAPYLIANGHWLFFYSVRPGGCNAGRQELWASHRQNKRDDFGWEPPINLGCAINTAGADDGAPNYWEDDATGIGYLYFARNYTPSDQNGFNIYVSTCTAGVNSCIEQESWSEPAIVAELNSPGFRNTKTAIRFRDGLEMIVTSNGPGTIGARDLWVTTRATAEDAWQPLVNLTEINSMSDDGAAALSWDGQTIVFYSGRSGGFGKNDLYMSTRQKLHGGQ